MTHKQLCQKCRSEHPVHGGQEAERHTDWDEKAWAEDKEVFCPHWGIGTWIPLKDIPHEDCIYAAEHVVLRKAPK